MFFFFYAVQSAVRYLLGHFWQSHRFIGAGNSFKVAAVMYGSCSSHAAPAMLPLT